MNMKNMRGKLVVITGGSSGIGYSLAERMAGLGAQLLLVARNEEKLRESSVALNKLNKTNKSNAGEIQFISADITDANDIKRLSSKLESLGRCADLVINSAGIVSAGLLHEVPLSEWDRLHNINVRALVHVLQTLIPAMISQSKQDGQARHIVNVASAAGFAGVPGMSAYGATKAAVIALSDSLRAELDPYNIGVTVICPDFVQTPIADTVQVFGRMDNPKTEKLIRKTFSSGKLTPEMVADKTLNAIEKNRGLVVIGRNASTGHLLKRLSPALLSRIMSKRKRSYEI